MAKTDRYTARQVIDAIERGYTPTGAATILGCHADTVRNYADRYPTVKRVLKAKRKELVDLGEIGLRAAIVRGEGWAIAFALKTLGKDEGYVERLEHTGRDGEAIKLKWTLDGDNPAAPTPGPMGDRA